MATIEIPDKESFIDEALRYTDLVSSMSDGAVRYALISALITIGVVDPMVKGKAVMLYGKISDTFSKTIERFERERATETTDA